MLKQIQAIHNDVAMFTNPIANGEQVEEPIHEDIELQAAAEIINIVGLAMDSTNIEHLIATTDRLEVIETCNELVKAAGVIRDRAILKG